MTWQEIHLNEHKQKYCRIKQQNFILSKHVDNTHKKIELNLLKFFLARLKMNPDLASY